MADDIYQEFIIELYKNPLNFGAIDNADYQAEAYNATCGDRITIYLRVDKGIVVEAKHKGKGCAISQASASLLTEHLRGMALEQVKKIDKKEIMDLIKIDLSKNPTRIRCALLPLDALRGAIKEKR